MRKSQNNQSRSNPAPQRGSKEAYSQKEPYGLEPPAQRAQRGTAPSRPGESQRFASSTDEARRPRTYQPYDLDAFERERTQAHRPFSDYNMDAFGSDLQPPSLPKRQQRRAAPAQEQQRPAAQRQAAAQKGVPNRTNAPQRQQAGGQRQAAPAARPAPGRGTGNRGSKGQQTQPYQNRLEQRALQNERRKKRMKRRRILTLSSLFLIVVIVSVVLCCTVFFKIDTIQIKGTDLYTEDQVLYMVDFKKGDNLLTLNRKGQEQTLPSKLPYVKSAKIKISLPGTVIIEVQNADPKYYYTAADGTFVYLDATLKVLESGAAVPPAMEGIISLDGTPFKSFPVGGVAVLEDEAMLQALTGIIKSLETVGLSKITAIQSVNQSTNFVVYDNRLTIKIGEAVNLDKKLTMAKTSIDSTQADNILNLPETKGILDVTVGKYAYFTASSS